MRAKRWRKWPILLVAVFTAFCLGSCQDWGEMDPPSGNQQLPNLTELASYDFDDLGSDVSIGIYQGGKAPKVVVDPQLDVVLELDGGYVSYANPLQYNTLQTGASLTGWVKLNAEDANASVFCFSDEAGNKLRLTGNSDLYYNEEKLNANSLLLTAGEWHWFAVAAKPHGYAIYIDGVAVDGTIAPGEGEEVAKAREVMDFMTTAPRLYFGYGSEETPSKMWIDEVTVYKNLITDAEVAKPELKDPNPGGEEPREDIELPEPVWFNDFEGDNADCTIHGSGSFENEGGVWGKVFQNDGGAQRTHYLQLPADVLSHSAESQELSIGVWVNAKNTAEAYNFAPLFMAYGAAPVNNENTFPMFACQYRGLLQINCAGYTDFTADQNVAGINTEYNELGGNDWLADDEWHYYTVTLTATNAKVYFDGEIRNEWNVSGTEDNNVIAGLFSNGADLNYICLGGNQAWAWADNDAAFMFDDIAIYNKALTKEQIATIIEQKSGNLLSKATAYYPLAGTYENSITVGQNAAGSIAGNGVAPSFVSDEIRGDVLLIPAGINADHGYVTIANPLAGKNNLDGATVSLWVNWTGTDPWSCLWSFFDETNGTGRLFLGNNAYLGYNNGVYFDANNPATVTNAIPADSWTMVTLTINNAGFAIYVDGQLKYDQDNVEAWASDPAEASSDYDYGLAMNTIKSSTNFYLNHGAFWNLVETKVSDLIIYDRVLSATEVSELKELTSK